jgi:hypothetical protein
MRAGQLVELVLLLLRGWDLAAAKVPRSVEKIGWPGGTAVEIIPASSLRRSPKPLARVASADFLQIYNARTPARTSPASLTWTLELRRATVDGGLAALGYTDPGLRRDRRTGRRRLVEALVLKN